MRERTTWNRDQIKSAAMGRRADPYTMNQDHPNPSADKYVNGDPSSWAEDVHPAAGEWEAEYAGGQVKRNEIGLPDFRPETFKTAEEKEYLLKKAAVCEQVARRMLPKTASASMIEDQSLSLMYMPDQELVQTFVRLAGDEEGQEQGEEEGQAQQKQAQEQVEGQGEEEGQAQQKEAAAQLQRAIKANDMPAIQSAIQQMVQQAQQQAQLAQQQQQGQQQVPLAQQQQGQQQQLTAEQVQQMISQAMQQQGQGCGSCGPTADDVIIDDMMGPGGEMDIEMEPAPMDVGEVQLGPDDAVLRQLFAQDEEQDQVQQEEVSQEQGQQKQAAIRTASTRTVGTRPTAGVSRVGGGVSGGSGSEVSKLSSLWTSAPDVSDVFGTTKS